VVSKFVSSLLFTRWEALLNNYPYFQKDFKTLQDFEDGKYY